MGALSGVTLGDVVRAMRRYQPVAIGLVILLAVFAVLPEPERVPGDSADGASMLDQTRASTGVTTSATSEASADVPIAVPGVADTAAFAPSFASASFDAGPSDSAFSDSSFSDSSAANDAFPSPDEPVATFGGPSIDSDTSSAGEPLRIVGSLWASRASGTPVASEGVPAGTLPVSVRVTDDKRSYVRLAGSQTVLRLAEEPTGARSTNGPALIQICQVTSAEWTDGEAVPLDSAPAWDAGSCVLGQRNDEGVWSFDLSSFPAPDDNRGFALLPAEGAGVDFQVAFKKNTAA